MTKPKGGKPISKHKTLDVMNAETCRAYITLRKYSAHYNILKTVLRDPIQKPEDVLREHCEYLNSETQRPYADFPVQLPYPTKGIDFKLIAKYWDANLPINNREKCEKYGVLPVRHTSQTH